MKRPRQRKEIGDRGRVGESEAGRQTVGVLLALALQLALLPFVLWRWLLAFGLIGGGIGYVLATTANRTSAFAQQQAMEFGLKGLLVGFAVGALYRLMRRVTRPARGGA